MISKSQHFSERLPHRMAVLLFTTYMVLSTFHLAYAPRTERIHFGLEQGQFINQTYRAGWRHPPPDRSVKIRRKVTYISPPVRISHPPGVGEAQLIRSVLVPRLFSYSVVQQPDSNPYYVSSSKKLITEFGLAKEHNTIGLLAHNNLAGKDFKYLKLGHEIYIVHKNGHTDRYVVSAIYRFQALESTNTESQFIDLESGETLTANELFTRMYTGAPHLTFQTCIYANGDASWGRLFVIATPVVEAN